MIPTNPVVGLGELLWDLLPAGRALGGAPTNFAFHCNQLGLPAAVVSRVGDDADGRDLRAALHNLGLSDEHVQTDPARPTGTVPVAVDARGQPTYTITEGVAWDALEWSPALEELADSALAVCYGSLAQRSPASAATIRRFLDVAGESGALRIFDINIRQHYYTDDVLRESLRRADWLKLNADELPVVARLSGPAGGDELALLRDLRRDHDLLLVCLTKGADGCVVVWDKGEAVVPGEPVDVVDTVGAGDSFTAALLWGMLGGRPSLADAARFANRLAGRVAASAGATPRLSPSDLKGP